MRRSILRAMYADGSIQSFAEGRRLIANGGVRVDGVLVEDFNLMLEPGEYKIYVGSEIARLGGKTYSHTVPKDVAPEGGWV